MDRGWKFLSGIATALLLSSSTLSFAIEGLPTVHTSQPWAMANRVLLNGFAAPNGLPTIAWFEWGTNEVWTETTESVAVAADRSMMRVSLQLSGVPMGHIYSCRLVSSNALGVVYGAPQHFGRECKLRVGVGNTVDYRFMKAGLRSFTAVACTDYRVMAILANGNLTSWGLGYTNVPMEATNMVSIAANSSVNAGLRADGRVLVWGSGSLNGPTNVPIDLTNVVALANGATHCVALKDDGTVASWGNTSDNIRVPESLSNVVEVAAGKWHSAALLIDGSVRVWGAASYTNTPGDWTNIISVACNSVATFALRADGSLTSWPVQNIPTNFTNLAEIYITVDSGMSGVRRDRTLAVNWWMNADARTNGIVSLSTGVSNFVLVLVPERVGKSFSLEPWSIRPTTAIMAGMVSANGLPTQAWFEWGTSSSLGRVTPPIGCGSSSGVTWVTNELSDLQRGGTYLYRLVSSNSSGIQRGALKRFTTGGRVKAWGRAPAPGAPDDLNTVVSADTGMDCSIALLNDGTVRCWGTDSLLTQVPKGLSNVVSACAGWKYNFVLKGDGSMVSWGYNMGQSNIPPGLSNVIAITVGGSHSAALSANGQVFVWGDGGFGSSSIKTVPLEAYNIVSIATSGDHMVALRNTGEVFAWGANLHGELQVPSTVTNSVAISAPVWNCVAMDSNGSPMIWGWNITGQTTPPSPLTNLVSVVGGWFHLLGLTAEGKVIAWGTNVVLLGNDNSVLVQPEGPATLPPNLTNVAAIGAGDAYSIVILPKLPPHASSLSVTGFLGNSLLIKLPQPVNYDGPACTFRCETLPTTGSLYHWTNGVSGRLVAVGDVISNPGGYVFYVPLPSQTEPTMDSFVYQAKDGTALSDSATVSIQMIIPVRILAGQSGFASPGAGGGFALRFTGPADTTHRVWASTNLLDWNPLGVATAGGDGAYEFLDSEQSKVQRFYQIRSE